MAEQSPILDHILMRLDDRFDAAYGYFNRELFGARLASCLIAVRPKKGMREKGVLGSFSGGPTPKDSLILINPAPIGIWPNRIVLSTLIHEMCHLQQHHYGEHKTEGGDHNEEWADMMEAVGLIPTDTGKPGGKRTGKAVSDLIAEGGPFDRACARLLAQGFPLWPIRRRYDEAARKAVEDQAKHTDTDRNHQS